MIEHKATAPEVPELVFHAGNLAILCVRAGRMDYASTLAQFQRIQVHAPMEVGSPLLPQVQGEIAGIRARLVSWLLDSTNTVRS